MKHFDYPFSWLEQGHLVWCPEHVNWHSYTRSHRRTSGLYLLVWRIYFYSILWAFSELLFEHQLKTFCCLVCFRDAYLHPRHRMLVECWDLWGILRRYAHSLCSTCILFVSTQQYCHLCHCCCLLELCAFGRDSLERWCLFYHSTTTCGHRTRIYEPSNSSWSFLSQRSPFGN